MLFYLKMLVTVLFPPSTSACGNKVPGTAEFSKEDETSERNKMDCVIHLYKLLNLWGSWDS